MAAPADEVVYLLQVDAPTEKPELRLKLRLASAIELVQILVATRASLRRSPSARPNTPSARPYIGDESKNRAPPSQTASTTSRAAGSSAGPTSNVCHVPRPTTGTSHPVPPKRRRSITATYPIDKGSRRMPRQRPSPVTAVGQRRGPRRGRRDPASCGRRYLLNRSTLTTPPWSDGHRPDGVLSLRSSPVTNARFVFSPGFVNTWSTVWSNTCVASNTSE